jgi:hypothetical protein
LTDLYELVATERRLSREAVPTNATGSAAAHQRSANLATAVHLAELRMSSGSGTDERHHRRLSPVTRASLRTLLAPSSRMDVLVAERRDPLDLTGRE